MVILPTFTNARICTFRITCLYISHDRKQIYSNSMFWKCLRVICMIIGISSLSHDSHPCNALITRYMSTDATFQFSRALARCDVINTARLCGDFTSYPLKSVKIQNRRRTRCYSGCRCSLISENCHCLHWCDFLLQETQPSRRVASGCGAQSLL